MTDYVAIYNRAYSVEARQFRSAKLVDWQLAGLAAVVAAAKMDALTEAAERVLGPSDDLRDASTCRQIALDLRERADAIGEGPL